MSILVLASLGLAADRSAWELYEDGKAAEKAGHVAEAYLLYSQAAAKDPKNQMYWLRSQAVRSRAALQSTPLPAIPEPGHLDKQFQEQTLAPLERATFEDLAEAQQPMPPTHLDATGGLKDFDVRGTSKEVFESVAKSWDLDCIFDKDYQAGSAFRYQMHDVDYRDSLHALEAATGSFIVPLTPKIFMVVKDTPQKRTELEPVVTVAIHMPESLVAQDFQDAVRYVQQTLALEKVAWNATTNMVVLRDRISKVVPAEGLLQQLTRPRPQIGLELKFLQVSHNDMVTYGINLPTAIHATVQNALQTPTGLNQLLSFGSTKTIIGISIATAAAVATMSKSSGTLLLDTFARSLSGQKATMHIGDRYPIVTGSYGVSAGANTAVNSGFALPPSFTFEDLGLKLTVTPLVHDTHEVSLDMEAEFKVLTGQSVNDIPVISNRSFKQAIRLKFDEYALVAGLLSTNDARTIAGLAGVSRIPVLKYFTSTNEHTDEREEVLILIRPMLLTLPPNETVANAIRTGSEARPLTPL